jgi:hypothetical protein
MMNKDHMYWIAVACVFVGLLIEGFLFMHEAKADVVIILSPGGVQEGTIITFPPPPPPYPPAPPAPPTR